MRSPEAAREVIRKATQTRVRSVVVAVDVEFTPVHPDFDAFELARAVRDVLVAGLPHGAARMTRAWIKHDGAPLRQEEEA